MKKTILFSLSLAMASASIAYGASFVMPGSAEYTPIIVANKTAYKLYIAPAKAGERMTRLFPGDTANIKIDKDNSGKALKLLVTGDDEHTYTYQIHSPNNFISNDYIEISGDPENLSATYIDGASVSMRGDRFNPDTYLFKAPLKIVKIVLAS